MYLSLIKKPQRWQVTTGLYGFMSHLYPFFFNIPACTGVK